MRKLFTMAAILLAMSAAAACHSTQKGTPQLDSILALIETIYNGHDEGKKPKATDPGTGLARIVYDSELDSEEGFEIVTIIYGQGVKASKKQIEEDYTVWVCEATDAHACYVRFQFDTDNGATVAFNNKADAEAFARQMKPRLSRDEYDLEYGSGTVNGFYVNKIEPQQDDNGWWTFSFHGG